MTTLTRNPDSTPPAVDPATDMLRTLLGDIQPQTMDDLLDIASIIGDVDGGHITAQTVVV
ncbi:hypothetical protein [Gordonia hongkongensis]|uniref:hypothetical protein n=1 Tax=Gordonia hongkongensis TaxID=1701090 RepID=UPI003D74A215